MRRTIIAALVALAACLALPAAAQSFDWKTQQGRTLTLLFNNHPWSQAMRELAADFTARTGIRTRLEILNEEQFRARLTTLMQGRSGDLDVFMSLPSREGAVFRRAGWYTDLGPLLADPKLTAPDFNYEDFGAGMRAQATLDGLVATLPINQEGPLLYYRRDLFARCQVAEPRALEDIPEAAQKLRECDANQGVWAARGLRGAVPYAMSGFIYNLGGGYTTPDGKPGLCQPASVRGLEMYAGLLKSYGPPGALNHTFTQVIELLGQGRVAMTHESSNEFANILRFPGRAEDIAVRVLPPGRETGISKPIVIGWGLAISAFSRQKEAAWLFLQWATGAEMQARLVRNGVAPPRASVFEGPAFQDWAKEMPIRRDWAAALVELGRTGTGVYQSPTDRIPEARDVIGNAVQQVVLGRAGAQEAACAADAELAKLQ